MGIHSGSNMILENRNDYNYIRVIGGGLSGVGLIPIKGSHNVSSLLSTGWFQEQI